MRIRLFAMASIAAVSASLVAMPTKQALRDAEGLVREQIRAELDAMRAGSKSRADVANAAVRLAEKETSEAARLLLLKGAFTFYVGHGAYNEAIDVFRTIKATISDIQPQNMANMLESALRASNRKDSRLDRILDEMRSQASHQDELKEGLREGLYCVVDLSCGSSALFYPVSFVSNAADIPVGTFNTDEYKTTKLVLRRIESGKFAMKGKFEVTLTKPYYIGIFEITQKQYELVTGANPSEFKGDKRPVEHVSYNMIRGSSYGAKWPASSAVDPMSFMGRLRARTGLDFDLPTEAQWEYACRAGTTSAFNNGGDSEDDMKRLGRYINNCSDGKGGYSQHYTAVGAYLPNAWGLYDMHGNVWEWCLDWAGELSSPMMDPKGTARGYTRILRGGSWGDNAMECCASRRLWHRPNRHMRGLGFRVVLTMPEDK